MLNDFFGHKIYTWNVENYKFLNLKNNIEFNQDLESYFSIASKKSSRPFESNGFAYSTSIENKHYHLFEELLTPDQLYLTKRTIFAGFNHSWVLQKT